MTRRNDRTLVEDIVEAAQAAVAAFEGSHVESLRTDHVKTLGLVKCIEIVGEASSKLSDEFRTRHESIPWREIIGMRNRLVHTYFEIDYEQVWQTLKEDLPPLIARLKAILAQEPAG